MSAGHRYRADGWCANAECFRHIADEPDFGFCPDKRGDGLSYRSDVPEDKRMMLRASKAEVLQAVVRAVKENPGAMLRSLARLLH